MLLALAVAGCRDDTTSDDADEGADASDGADSDDGDATADDDDDDDADDDDDDAAPVGEIDPGRVTLHRLNRTEYDNTMRDLFFGLDLHPAQDFPADDVALGYDNIADVLSVTPLLFELYEGAAVEMLEAALDDPDNGEVRDAILVCDPAGNDAEECGRTILRTFGDRAWRRPLTDAEVERVHQHVDVTMDAGGTRLEGIRLGLQQLLMSAHFLFRVEIDPAPDSDQPHLLGDYELASRLSYFMWSSMPDDELLSLAWQGVLHDADVLDAQFDRMLADTRALSLLDDFAGQWLRIRAMKTMSKDAESFPDFDDALRDAMHDEARAMVRDLFTGERDVLDLLVADTTVANDRLAMHYGLPAPGTSELVPVSLQDVPRRGLLTTAGMMTLLSQGVGTTPSRRGAWVLSQILCTPPPPPPPEVDDSLPPPQGATTTRELLEQHRSDPTCAACHALVDPVGFAFEHYDAVGAYRSEENGQPIDATGELPDGTPFDGAPELTQAWADAPGPFAQCVAKQLLTYAVGREIVGPDDGEHVGALAATLTDADFRLRDLLRATVHSDAFRARRGEPD